MEMGKRMELEAQRAEHNATGHEPRVFPVDDRQKAAKDDYARELKAQMEAQQRRKLAEKRHEQQLGAGQVWLTFGDDRTQKKKKIEQEAYARALRQQMEVKQRQQQLSDNVGTTIVTGKLLGTSSADLLQLSFVR